MGALIICHQSSHCIHSWESHMHLICVILGLSEYSVAAKPGCRGIYGAAIQAWLVGGSL